MLNTIILLGLLTLFYRSGGFKALIRAAERATEEPQPARVEPIRTPEPEPPKEPEESPEDKRRKLERIAQNCLSCMGVKFDTYYYTKSKSDLELMDIITNFNMNN